MLYVLAALLAIVNKMLQRHDRTANYHSFKCPGYQRIVSR